MIWFFLNFLEFFRRYDKAWDSSRAGMIPSSFEQILNAFKICSKLEGIIPALEPSHALSYLLKNSKKFKKNEIIIMNMCGRGDKDIFSISDSLGIKI